MGLFSSSSKSNQTSNITDRRIGASDALIASEGSVINFTDAGAIAAGAQVQTTALHTVENTLRSGTQQLLQTTGKIFEDVIEGNRKVVDRSLDSVDLATVRGINASIDALDSVESVAESAFKFGGESLKFGEISNESVARANQDALSFVEQFSRSDAKESLDNLVKYTALAGAVIAVAWAYRG